MLLAGIMAVFGERRQEAVPVGRSYPVIGYSHLFYPLFSSHAVFRSPFPRTANQRFEAAISPVSRGRRK
jgi:hypothetical protein